MENPIPAPHVSSYKLNLEKLQELTNLDLNIQHRSPHTETDTYLSEFSSVHLLLGRKQHNLSSRLRL